tara:strand:- start:203 stop:646 length:444 start_codon:yes stop_codon:yes gene_type:complete
LHAAFAVSIVEMQHGVVNYDKPKKVLDLVTSGPPVVAACALQWITSCLEDSSLSGRESFHQLIPIFLQIVVAAAGKHSMQHAQCFYILRRVLSLKDHSRGAVVGDLYDSKSSHYGISAAHKDAWDSVIYLMKLGFVAEPLKYVISED